MQAISNLKEFHKVRKMKLSFCTLLIFILVVESPFGAPFEYDDIRATIGLYRGRHVGGNGGYGGKSELKI